MGINYNQYEELELIELIATYEGNISSESELSERFDETFTDFIESNRLEDDEPAISELFNNWTDSLCKDGEIHEVQCNKYCYVGNFS